MTGEYSLVNPRKRSIATLRLDSEFLVHLLLAIKDNYDTNFAGALLVLGGYIVSLHYESLMEKYNNVPATIVYGEVQCGKSLITKAVLATTGVQNANFFSSLSDPRTFAFSSQTTLGMVLDDPCDVKQVARKLTYHFQKAPAATMCYEHTPKTTFLTSMNIPTLQQLAKHARYAYKCFYIHVHISKYTMHYNSSQSSYCDKNVRYIFCIHMHVG